MSGTNEELKKSEVDNEFLKERGTTLFSDSASARTIAEDRWTKDNDAYNGKFSEKERKFSEVLGTDRLYINKTYTNVQRIVVDIVDTFMSDAEEIVDVKAQKNLDFAYTQAVKALLNYRLDSHPINFYQELYEYAMFGVKNSAGLFKVYPELRTKKVKKKEKRISDDGKEFEKEVEVEDITAYSPRFESVNPEDVFFSKRSTWKDYWKHQVIHRFEKTREEAKIAGYKNISAVAENTDSTLGEEVKMERFEDSEEKWSDQEAVYQNQKIIVYEIWDHLPDENGDIQSGSYVMLGTSKGPEVVGRGWEVNELPYRFDDLEMNRPPIIYCPAFPEAGKLRGKSYPQNTEALQKETNAQRNQFREAVARALRPHMYVNKDAEVDLMSLVNRRIGAYIQGIGPAGGAISEIPSMNPNFVNSGHQAVIDRDYEQAGLPDNLSGFSQREETATVATQQLQNANKKIQLVIMSMSVGILQAFRYLLRLEQLYATDEFINSVTGRTLGWVLPNDQFPAREVIQGDFDLKVNLGMNKQQQINRMMLMFDRASQGNQVTMQMVQAGVVPIEQAKFKDTSKIIDEMLKILGFKNVDEWNIQAQQPPPQQGEPKGIASQPSPAGDPSQTNVALEPQGTGDFGVL